MARGFLSGVLWGGVVGVTVSGAASVLAPLTPAPDVADAAPGAAEAPERIVDASSGESGSESDRTVVKGLVAPQAPPPDPDTLNTLEAGATETAAQPETGQAEDLADPARVADSSGVDVGAEAPVLPNPQALAPMAPQEADDLSISTEPAQPPAPAAPEVETAFDAPTQPDAPDVEDDAELATPQAPEQPATPDTAEVEPVEEEAAEQEIAEAEQVPDTAEDTQVAALAPEPESEPEDPPAAATESASEPESTAEPEPVAQEPAEENTRPRIGELAGTLTDRGTGVAIRRPGVASLGQVDDGDATQTVDDGEVADADPRPIARFAQTFDDPEGKPLMSIVLIDNGKSLVAGAAGIAALQSFPYPLSFAVDTRLPDAVDRMATYRKAGFEVLAMIDLPEGAQPTDAETALGAILPQMSEVVGVLEGTDGGLQVARDVSDQVTSILKETGHGLLTQNRGLNTMPKLARKEGVPAEPVFRDFDSKDQSAQVIRRFLDQAAFKAGQEGAVVMLGRLRPDTISALLLWGLQDRAGSVALTPISAVLLREEG